MKGLAVLLADFVDGADVGMVQRRGGLRFTLETGQSLGVSGHLIGQELEGYKAVAARVLGLVDHTHPAAAELLDNAVVRDGLADHWRESYAGKTGKSMKAMELTVSQKGSWRKIAITLIDPGSPILNEFYKKGCQEKSSPSTGGREDFVSRSSPLHCQSASRFAREVLLLSCLPFL